MADYSKILGGLGKAGKRTDDSSLSAIRDAGRAAHQEQSAARAAKNAEVAEQLARLPGRNRQAAEAAGLFHPIGGGLKLSRPPSGMHATTVADPEFVQPEIKIITPAQMVKERAAIIPLVGDRAAGGRYLTHIDELEFERPIRLTAGSRYMDANYNPLTPEESAAWESGLGVVTKIGNQATRAGAGGRPVYGAYTAGSGTNTDFNVMGTNALLQQIPTSAFTKKAEQQFDRAMRKGTKDFPAIPNWPGIRNPLAEELLLDKSNGIMRTKLFDTMGKENFQSMGFPDVPATRKAIIEPELLDVPTNQVGFRLANMDTTGRIIKNPKIPSDYPVAMAGKLAGQLDEPEDYKDIFQSHFDARRLLSQPEKGDYYSFSRAKPIQYADEEWLNRLMESRRLRDEAIKKGSYAEGGAVDIEAADARLSAAISQRMAKGGKVDIEAADARLEQAIAQRMAGDVPRETSEGVQHMAGGGKGEVVKGVAKGFKRLFANRDVPVLSSSALPESKVLPRVEADANLAKFLEKSNVKKRAYHATNQDVKNFNPKLDARTENKSNISGWFTADPEFANDFASQKYRYWKTQHRPWEQDPNVPSGVNIMPVHLSMENPFNATDFIKNLSGELDMSEAAGVAKALGVELDELLASIPKTIKYKANDYEREHMPRGFDLVKSELATDAMRRMGHDGVIAVENGAEVYAPFKSGQVKSAIGNRGTYDINEEDITKAEGGLAMGRGGEAVKRGFKRLLGRTDPTGPLSARRGLDEAGGNTIIKEGGGNWMAGDVERGLSGLKRNELSPEDLALARNVITEYKGDPNFTAGQIRRLDEYERDALTNKLIDKQIANYVKNQMGTKDDPIRLAADAFPAQKAKLLADKQVQIDKATADMEKARQSRGFTPEMMTRSQARIRALEKERELLERRVGLHYEPQGGAVASFKARQQAGFPVDPTSTTPYGQSWENISDAAIEGSPYRMRLPMVTQETASDALRELGGEFAVKNPNAMAYSIKGGDLNDVVLGRNLGFDHMMDEMRNATNIESGLPKELLIDPKNLSKWTMPQVAEHVDKINAWRASQKAEADLVRANNAATVLHKDYPEKGMKWVELKTPEATLPEGSTWEEYAGNQRLFGPSGESLSMGATKEEAMRLLNRQEREGTLADALKYEGEQLQHCVGGYCPDVISGKSRIYSLRDAKGNPHATVEVKPSDQFASRDRLFDLSPEEYSKVARHAEDILKKGQITDLNAAMTAAANDLLGPPAQKIAQIKGKGNAAPSEEYLPYVQDFVRSGNYGDVKDLQNTGLMRKSDYIDEFTPNQLDSIGSGEYVTKQELDSLRLPPEGMAEGGAAFKTLQWQTPQRFDDGGVVDAPAFGNPNILAQGSKLVPNKRLGDIKKNAAEIFEDSKKSLEFDYERLKSSPDARAQLAKIVAAQIAAGGPDLVEFGANVALDPLKSMTIDKVFTKPRQPSVMETPYNPRSPRKSEHEKERINQIYGKGRVPMFGSISDALKTKDGIPFGGSEYAIKRMQDAGLMYGGKKTITDPYTGEKTEINPGRFSPITEIAGSILGGAGISKLGKATKAGYKKFTDPKLNTLQPPLALPPPSDYLPATTTQTLEGEYRRLSPLLQQPPVKLIPEAMTAPAGKPQGATYATKQEGPFYRVSPTTLDTSTAKSRGIREADELQSPTSVGGGAEQAGREVPQLLSPEEVGRIIADPVANEPLNIAKKYTKDKLGTDFGLPEIPESSLAKQSAIGRAQQLAIEGSPEYKSAVFDAYAKQMPDLLEQVGAKNYDDLMEKAYRQMAKETDEQFKQLPYNFSYHRSGEGNYNGAMDMASDVHGNKHLYVYQGGDAHDFLNRLDKASGLNENEKFRAVHDLLGHAVYGNQFGPKGEEIAYAVHGQMYSPLARLAMASETRGQNSMVNYSPLNANLKSEIAKYDNMAYEAKRRGDTALVNEINALKRQAYAGFEFAPNKAVLLPPEFVDPKFSGGMPDYLSEANRPVKGTESQSVLTHFSNDPKLQSVDPTRYGTGITGEEAQRLRDYAGGVKDRSYFYLGEPGTIAPEPGLGVNRYRGESQNLYDITKDPLSFRALARESNRTPFTAQVNAGMTSPLQEANDYERLVKEYGYEGMINPNASKPMGIMFKPTEVQPRKRGGLAKL